MIVATAKAHNVSVAQIALRFIVQNGVAAIPKGGCGYSVARAECNSSSVVSAASEARYQVENMAVFDWSLSAEEMAALAVMTTPYFRGHVDAVSQMCVDEGKGTMARCSYVDA